MAVRTKSFGQIADRLRERGIRFAQLRFSSGNNHMIGMETVVHQFAMRLSMQQFF
jgi:hypothetical protein